LSRRADLAALAALIRDLQTATSVDGWLLVGAMARDLWLYYAHGIATGRATTDVDFAVALTDWAEFEALRKRLVASGRFTPMTPAHRLRHASGRRVDLVPFGGVADAHDVIAWPPDGDSRMNVTGYDEACAAAARVRLPDGIEVRAVTLPGLLILKVRAWAERHVEQPLKDAHDLYLILRRYLDAGNADRLYAEHAAWLTQSDFDYGTAGARLAGLDVRALLGQHSDRSDEIIAGLQHIIAPEIDADGQNRLVGELRDDADAFRGYLIAFSQGLSGAVT